MSVVVLGMNAPKSCYGCDLARFLSTKEPYCIRTMKVVGLPGKRPNWCPLHPLPEKHGRLIDADDYAAEMKERQADAMLWKEKAARNNDMTTFARGDQAMRTFSEAKLTLDNMETIVEAEGD